MARIDIVNNVEDNADDAESLVRSQFGAAQTWAGSMLAQTMTFLAQLQTATSFTVPSVSLDVSLPTTITFPSFDAQAPADLVLSYATPDVPVVNITPLDGSFSFAVSDYASNLGDELIAKIRTDLAAGGSGLSAAVEQAIYDRATARRETEDVRIYTEAENYFASRGWALPPGMLSGRLLEIQKEITRDNNRINAEILIKQAELADTNTRFIKELAAKIEEMLRTFYIQDQTFELNLSNSRVDASVKEFETKISKTRTEIEKYSAETQAVLGQIQAQVNAYLGEVEAYKAEAGAYDAVVGAQAASYKAIADVATAEAQVEVARVNTALQPILAESSLRVEAAKGGASVAAQIAAGAMSAVNAGVNFNYAGGQEVRVDYNDSLSSSESESVQTMYQHIYGE